jgi:hypothetical protein
MALTFPVVWYFSDQYRLEKVALPVSSGFPVVIFSRNSADIIFYGDIDYQTRIHPDYTFLAPIGQDDSINGMLTESLRKKRSSASPEIKVEQISPTRQSIELGLYGDGETIAWYEATDKEIFPKAIKQLGPMFMAIVFLKSFIISIAILGVSYGLIKGYKAISERPLS